MISHSVANCGCMHGFPPITATTPGKPARLFSPLRKFSGVMSQKPTWFSRSRVQFEQARSHLLVTSMQMICIALGARIFWMAAEAKSVWTADEARSDKESVPFLGRSRRVSSGPARDLAALMADVGEVAGLALRPGRLVIRRTQVEHRMQAPGHARPEGRIRVRDGQVPGPCAIAAAVADRPPITSGSAPSGSMRRPI